jgi:hypothetical protein
MDSVDELSMVELLIAVLLCDRYRSSTAKT